MVNGLHLYSAFSTLAALKALHILPLIHPFILTLTHTDGSRAPVQGAGLPIGSNLGFRVLLKDTSSHDLGGVGDRTANLAINRRPTVPPEPQPPQSADGVRDRTANLRLTDDPLYPLSHSRPNLWISFISITAVMDINKLLSYIVWLLQVMLAR